MDVGESSFPQWPLGLGGDDNIYIYIYNIPTTVTWPFSQLAMLLAPPVAPQRTTKPFYASYPGR